MDCDISHYYPFGTVIVSMRNYSYYTQTTEGAGESQQSMEHQTVHYAEKVSAS